MWCVGLARKLEAVQRTQRITLEGRGWDSSVEMVGLLSTIENLLNCTVVFYIVIGEHVIPGNVLVRQRGTVFHPGLNVRHSTIDYRATYIYLSIVILLLPPPSHISLSLLSLSCRSVWVGITLSTR